MGRPYPNRRRKRPGRRPPHRYRGAGPPVRPNGFQDLGLKTLYDWILPRLGVRNRRQHFNEMSARIVVGMGLAGAVMGSISAGPAGAIVGFGAGLAFAAYIVQKHRFYRR